MLRARLPPGIFKETGQETSSLFSFADRQGSVTRTGGMQLVTKRSEYICLSKPFFFHYPGQETRRLVPTLCLFKYE